ncbi:MAG: cation:proton antiporter domain-containing protein [Nitrososphaerales archaeon]
MVDESTLIISLLVSIVALGIISEIMFHKFRIPEPIVLLTLGLLIQYSGIIPGGQGTLDYLRSIAPILGTIVLGLVLLDAGLGMRAYDMLVRSPKVLALALLEPITTALGFSAIMYLAFGWPLIYGAIFGALLATTTGEVIVPLLRSIKTDEGTENTLILDSVYNSVTTIVIFQVLFDFVSSPTSLSFSSSLASVASAFVFGAIVGVLAGFAWTLIALKRIKEHQYLITMAAAFAVYLGSQAIGGNGLLSILLFGMVIGNFNESYRKVLGTVVHGTVMGTLSNELGNVLKISDDDSVKNLRNTQKEITFISKVFFFVFLGLIFVFEGKWLIFGVIFAFLLFALKYLDVKIVRPNANHKVVALVGPRGITPIILSAEFAAWAQASKSSSFQTFIAEPLLSMTFVIIFTTIAAAVLFAVVFAQDKKVAIPVENSFE